MEQVDDNTLGTILAKLDPHSIISLKQTNKQLRDACTRVCSEHFWERKLYLDYGHQQVIFEPNKAFRQPFEFDSSGLVLTAEGDDLRSFRVLRVIEGSPALEAGLREGDELVALDGRSTSSLTLETLRASLIAPGKSRQLEVRRDGQTTRTRVMLRRLV